MSLELWWYGSWENYAEVGVEEHGSHEGSNCGDGSFWK
jgi:hypothetical protein